MRRPKAHRSRAMSERRLGAACFLQDPTAPGGLHHENQHFRPHPLQHRQSNAARGSSRGEFARTSSGESEAPSDTSPSPIAETGPGPHSSSACGSSAFPDSIFQRRSEPSADSLPNWRSHARPCEILDHRRRARAHACDAPGAITSLRQRVPGQNDHDIASQNVTLGCSPTTYCPTQTITRDAMASFIAKALVEVRDPELGRP